VQQLLSALELRSSRRMVRVTFDRPRTYAAEASAGVLQTMLSTAWTGPCSSSQMALYTSCCRWTGRFPSNKDDTTSIDTCDPFGSSYAPADNKGVERMKIKKEYKGTRTAGKSVSTPARDRWGAAAAGETSLFERSVSPDEGCRTPSYRHKPTHLSL
jgi:hypothetical protein